MSCQLCKKKSPLRNSHIFPEWLYEPLYDERHQYFVLSTDPNKKRGTRPKGIYDKLFCGECETLLSEWEGYAREIFHSALLGKKVNKEMITLYGIEYAPFKLFQMSLLWRASLTDRKEIHRIDLGHHKELLRTMLFEKRAGEPYEYGVMLMLPSIDQDLMQQFIYSPERAPTKLDSHTVYRAAFGGMFWLFLVSNHMDRFPHKELFLSEEGRLPIVRVGKSASRFMGRLASDFSLADMFKIQS